MLPGLRFLFAASLLTASLLVFGMGAIALLRASHQQVANLTAQPAPEPVFAQAPETVPALSMLRTDTATAEAAPIAAEAGRLAALTSAVREPVSVPAPVVAPEPPPILAEPQSVAAPLESRSDAAPEPDIPPQAAPAESTMIATAPADFTGSTPDPVVTEPAMPSILNPPLPHARPEAADKIAALISASTTAPKVAAVKKARPIKRRYARREPVRVEPATSSNPLSALFGGGN